MARKATVDRDTALQMLRAGNSTGAVARHFGVSRQAIDLHRREFIKEGLLTDRRAPRETAAREEPARTGAGNAASGERGRADIPLDRLIDLVIEAFDSLKKVPELEAELEKCRRQHQQAAGRIELLEKELSKRKEQEARWLSARHGETGQPPAGR